MAADRREWLDRIRVVEREQRVMRLAVDRLLDDIRKGLDLTPFRLETPDVRLASARLAGTYVIRLFGEFESGLRACWAATRRNRPPARTRDLIDGMASRHRIPTNRREAVHEVREYRNTLVHEREEEGPPVSAADSCDRLCAFFAYLPPSW